LRVAEGFLQARGEGHCESAPDAAGSYLPCLTMLVPKEMKLEHQAGIKSMTEGGNFAIGGYA